MPSRAEDNARLAEIQRRQAEAKAKCGCGHKKDWHAWPVRHCLKCNCPGYKEAE